MASTFNLKVITPDGIKFNDDVVCIEATTAKGRIGIYAHHVNLIATLKSSIIGIRTKANHRDEYVITSGHLFFENNQAKVITDKFINLKDVNVKPANLMNKFCKNTEAFVARSMPSIAHIFDELYSIPKCILEGYLKVKVLELMLFLSSIDTKTDEIVERSFSHSQKLLAQNISSYLLDHIGCKITLEQLTGIFHVSGTQIKSSIKAVYGVSLYNMIRIQKMQSAARLLQETDLTILEIAGRHGYDNASKFANVFKSYMGLTPKEYRNKPTKIENVYIQKFNCLNGA